MGLSPLPGEVMNVDTAEVQCNHFGIYSTLIPKTSLYKMHPFMQLPVVLALYHGVGLFHVKSVRRAFISQKVELTFVTSVTLAK